jgi:hypothetical protein
MKSALLRLTPLAAVVFLAAGCSKQPALDPAVVAEHRSRLELAEEPDGAQTVLEVRQAMYGETPPDEHSHVHEASGEDHVHAAVEQHADEQASDVAAAENPTVAETGDTPGAADDHAEHEHSHDASDADHADHDHADHDHADHDHADHDHAAEDHDHADHDHESDAQPAKAPIQDELSVVMVGPVGGLPNPSEQSHPEFPFAQGKAMFFLADPEAVAEMEEHEHQHAPGEECSFCAAHAGDSAHLLAVVRFADSEGKLLAVDVRELFDLKEKETVVVQGKAKVDPSGLLTVDATGLYVRR